MSDAHVARLPVLGVATTFTTDSPAILERIRAAYGGWSALPERLVSPSPARVRILRDEGEEHPEGARFAYRVPEPTRMVVALDRDIGVADAALSESWGLASPGLIARPVEFAEGLLDPLTLFLLSSLDRQPLHAAGVVRDGVALLLAGPSGSGKSTLSYAARARGFTILSDDAVYVQLVPRLRVWGRRARIHLREEARTHFRELGGTAATRLASGKTKIVVAERGDEPRCAERVGLCLLRRGDGSRPTLERLEPGRAAAELTARLDEGFALFASSIGERIRAVAEAGAWALTLAGRPEDALPLLDQAAAAVAARA